MIFCTTLKRKTNASQNNTIHMFLLKMKGQRARNSFRSLTLSIRRMHVAFSNVRCIVSTINKDYLSSMYIVTTKKKLFVAH